MKKITIAYLMGFVTALAHAAPPIVVEKKVVCDNLKTIIESISADANEVPTWSGRDDTSKYILMANTKTGTWTMIQFNDKIACILGAGENSTVVRSGKYL